MPATSRPLTQAGYQRVPIADLRTFPGNARIGDVDAIAASLEARGQYKPLVVAADGVVLAGNHTLAAMQKLGWTEADIWQLPIASDDQRATEIVLVDNRTAELGKGYDPEALVKLLESVPSYADAALGYDRQDMAALLAKTAQKTETDPDVAPPLPDAPYTQPGDVWVLGGGRHALRCGDATNPDDLAAALAALDVGAADCMWTDPPYGVDYVGKTAAALTIQNDAKADLPSLLTNAFAASREVLEPGAPVYVAHADTERIAFEQALAGAGYLFRQNLVWVKNVMVLGRADYHYQHEPILYGFAPGGEGRLGRGGPRWYGANNATTVLEADVPKAKRKRPSTVLRADKPSANKDHPTMKPTELITQCLRNSARPGHVVLDPFAGSGSTLVAAHLYGARSAGTELDPLYADVIALRFQRLTGHVPVLLRDGERREVDLDA